MFASLLISSSLKRQDGEHHSAIPPSLKCDRWINFGTLALEWCICSNGFGWALCP